MAWRLRHLLYACITAPGDGDYVVCKPPLGLYAGVMRFIWNLFDWVAPAVSVSALAALLFGGYGILGAFVLEVALLWVRTLYFLPWDTGMEGLATLIGTGYLAVANLVVFTVYKVGRRLRAP
jgi:hypothetical protein